jgi:tetratricopeptide (TPR) repeat protein
MAGRPLPQQVASLLSQGVALQRTGRLLEARNRFHQVLGLDPGNVHALTQIGLLDIRERRLTDAATRFEEAVRREPRSPDLRNNLAALYLRLGRPDIARRHAKIADRHAKDSTETLKILFECAYALGEIGEAKSFVQRALALKPNDPSLTLDLAQLEDVTGEPDEACNLFRSLIASGQTSVFAYDGIARSQTFRSEPPEYAEMVAIIASGRASARDLVWLHSALGKIDEDLGRFDEAFAHFLASKSPARAHTHVQAFEKEVALLKQVFTRSFFAERREFATRSERPVFVFGMPRSGSTLVEQVLSSHRAIHGAGELSFLQIAVDEAFPKDRTSEAFARAVCEWPRADAQAMAADYLALLEAHDRGASRVVDKMPHNFQRLWLLALLFPKASFIHCRRDPIATCVSCFSKPLGGTNAFADDLGTLGRYYLLYEELMQFWQQNLPVRIVEIRYEDLVSEPEPQSRRLVAASGMDWDERCLDFHKTRRAVRTPSRRQVEQPIYKESVLSWQRYRKHLGPLVEALGPFANAK